MMKPADKNKTGRTDREQKELVQVIADFLNMGHVENIVAMFKQDPSCYGLTGQLIRDERFMVRVGTAVLLEELKVARPGDLELAMPGLISRLADPTPFVRGEAATLLGIIGSERGVDALASLRDDPDPQVREIVADILAEREQ